MVLTSVHNYAVYSFVCMTCACMPQHVCVCGCGHAYVLYTFDCCMCSKIIRCYIALAIYVAKYIVAYSYITSS